MSAPRPRAVITGAARRVGRAIALELARSGFDLVLHHRGSVAEAEATAAEAEALGAEVTRVSADLADPDGARAVVAAVAARWDTVHLLVHNASTFEPCPIDQIDVAAWDRMMAVHARAPFLITQGLLPQLRAAKSCAAGAAEGEGGLVVCMVDIGAERPVAGYAHYSVSKAALLMLVRCLAVETAPAVRAIGVSPGQVVWPEDYDEATRERLARRIPMRRVGTPDDVARLVRFVALEAPYLNGIVVDVDGGLAVRYG